MSVARRGEEPDPGTASNQREFRTRLRELMLWAGYTSLQQLETAATRHGTTMPVSTVNRALKNDGLPTADFVLRFTTVCGANVKQWSAVRDKLHDLGHLRDAAPDAGRTDEKCDKKLPIVANICPYPGMAAFGPNEAQWFFGREKETVELLSLLTARLDGTGPLVVIGPSGTGKSSLLRAGLSSSLAEGRMPGSESRPLLVFTPTADPVRELAVQLATVAQIDHREIVSALRTNPSYASEVLQNRPNLNVAGCYSNPDAAVLVVDQFEEVFALCPDERDRRVFIQALCMAATSTAGTPAALVVLGLRADFFGRCTVYPDLVEAVQRGPLMLMAMTDAGLRAAITKPAHAVGLDLEPGLVEVILADLGVGDETAVETGDRPSSLPLLAHALLATWQQRDDRLLTIAGYRLAGGISGAIAKTAERAYRMLEPSRQEIAQIILLRMIQIGDGADDTRRQIEHGGMVAESADSAGVEEVLNALVDARLVTTNETTIEIVHEVLLRAWPRLRQWIDADREELLLQQRLCEAAAAWDRDGRHESDLYRGHRLATLSDRADTADPRLPVLANEFLHASVCREREEQLGVLRRSRLRKLIAVLSAIMLTAVTAAVFAVWSRNNAIQLQKETLSREVSAAAIQLRVSERVLAAQLAVAAYQLSPTPDSSGAVLSTLVNLDLPRWTNVDSQMPVGTIAFSSDGKLLLAASRETSIWKMGDQPSLNDEPPIALPHPDQVLAAVFSHDDRLVATSSRDNVVRLWTVDDVLRDGAQPQPIAEIEPVLARPLAFSWDNSVLATGGMTPETIQLWDLTAGKPQRAGTISGHKGEVLAVAISPEGQHLASAGKDGTARLWDITDPDSPHEVSVVDQNIEYINDVAFSPDGTILATANSDKTARLFDISDPQKHQPAATPLVGHQGPVTSVAFSTDGTTLATTSEDTTARLWTITDPSNSILLTPPASNDEQIQSAAFSSDRHTLAMAGYGQDVRLWETDVERAVTEICEIVTSPITPEQWQNYFPEREYEPPCPAHVDREVGKVSPKAPVNSTPLIALPSEKCVAIKNDGAVTGAPAHQIDCTGTSDQSWILHDEPTAAPGNIDERIVQIVNATSSMCLESADSERKYGGATEVVQRPCINGEGSQLWILNVLDQRTDSADIVLLGLKNHDCLNINGEATTNGAYVVRWPCNAPKAHFRINREAISG